MELLYKTIAVYDQPFSPESIGLVEAKIDELIAQGKTDGNRAASWPVFPAEVIRFWVNEAAANEWKNYCLTVSPAPASFVIESV
jgi:hypothetical protein